MAELAVTARARAMALLAAAEGKGATQEAALLARIPA